MQNLKAQGNYILFIIYIGYKRTKFYKGNTCTWSSKERLCSKWQKIIPILKNQMENKERGFRGATSNPTAQVRIVKSFESLKLVLSSIKAHTSRSVTKWTTPPYHLWQNKWMNRNMACSSLAQIPLVYGPIRLGLSLACLGLVKLVFKLVRIVLGSTLTYFRTYLSLIRALSVRKYLFIKQTY